MNLLRQGKVSEQVYNNVESTGAQPARLYGLAKVHKKGTPLRPILSLPGSCYERLTKTLSGFFDNIAESQIETSSMEVKEGLVRLELDEDEVLVSPGVKSLFTGVPVVESINLAAKILYDRPVTPFEKETFITLRWMMLPWGRL